MIRVQRVMQKIRWPKDITRPTSIRAPGLRFTFDNPSGKDENDFELPLLGAQVLVIRTAAKFLNEPFQVTLEIEQHQVIPGDVILPTPDAESEEEEEEEEEQEN